MPTTGSFRNPSVMGRRFQTTTAGTETPTPSSGRASLDYYHSNLSTTNASPINGLTPNSNNSSSRSSIATSKPNRVALREYYNLKGAPAGATETSRITAPSTTSTMITDRVDDIVTNTDANSIVSSLPDYNIPYEPSEIDQPDFDVEAFVKRVLEEQTLTELLTTYNSLVAEIRALDSEQKALVYDNYSKLITATDTIAKMRECVESGEPSTGTLNVVIEGIYSKAEQLKKNIDKVSEAIVEKQIAEQKTKKIKARNVARRVLDTPEKVRNLIREGNQDEAIKIWEEVRMILMKWKEREVGGPDVIECIEDGDRALRGEPPTEKSWVNIKDKSDETQK